MTRTQMLSYRNGLLCPHCGNRDPKLIDDNGCRGEDRSFVCRKRVKVEDCSFEHDIQPDADGLTKCGMQWDRANYTEFDVDEQENPCRFCNGEYHFSRHCGAWVCDDCDDHRGLARCYCGWARSGGDGRQELIDHGETIEEED